jgi:hypothetical protein
MPDLLDFLNDDAVALLERDPLCTCKGEHDSRTAPTCPASLEHTLEIPRVASASDPHWTSEPARCAPRSTLEARFSDLSEFVRKITEGEEFYPRSGVEGQRAIELAAWDLYCKLQESHDL